MTTKTMQVTEGQIETFARFNGMRPDFVYSVLFGRAHPDQRELVMMLRSYDDCPYIPEPLPAKLEAR